MASKLDRVSLASVYAWGMKSVRPAMLALALAGAALLTSCLKKSLDIYTPADSHEYIALCVQDFGPNCEALQPTVKTLSHDISILIGNSDATEEFTAYAKAHGLTLDQFLTSPLREKYARANIFPVGRLTTGTFKSLDGTPHQFVCQDERECVMDGTKHLFQQMPDQRTGSIYMTPRTIFP